MPDPAQESPQPESESSGPAAVAARNVWKIFGERAPEALAAARAGDTEIRERFGAVIGVRDVSFEVQAGEIFCILGRAGSGKSTLLRLVNRLVEPTDGQILVRGEEVGGLSPEELRSLRADRIGMVFQDMALLPHRTVRDNVGFGLELRGVDTYTRLHVADRILAMLPLEDCGDRMPGELSAGMRQRVGLARALAADPELLLMDEPFSLLDPPARRSLQGEFLPLLRRLGKTTLLATRDFGEATRLGSRIAILHDGRVVQIGTPKQIMTEPADAHVTDLVKGISCRERISAHTLMIPPERYAAGDGVPADTRHWPQAAPGTDLDSLVGIAVGREQPIAVLDGGRLVGIVTKDALLRGLQGEI